MFTLTSLTAPLASLTAFSSNGPSCLHGPHQGAQKSTITGTSMEASITSRSNDDSVASIMAVPYPLIDRGRNDAPRSGSAAVNGVRPAREVPQEFSYLTDNHDNSFRSA